MAGCGVIALFHPQITSTPAVRVLRVRHIFPSEGCLSVIPLRPGMIVPAPDEIIHVLDDLTSAKHISIRRPRVLRDLGYSIAAD